jgi:hypothetical protein
LINCFIASTAWSVLPQAVCLVTTVLI